MRANEFANELIEARRNNFGREISNVQGQALGKKLAAGDPNAQQALAQAKAAQATNKTDNTGGVLGKTTPQQRLAAKKAQAAGPAIDADEIRTPTQQTPAAQEPAAQGPSTTDKMKSAWNTTKGAAGAVGSAIGGIPQAVDRMAQSQLGQKLGGWSQRLIGIGNKSAAAQQYWMKNYMSMVNNMIANAKNSQIKFNFGNAIDQYMMKQKLKLDPNQRRIIIASANKVQQNGFQRDDIIKLGNTLWTTGLNATKSAYATTDKINPIKNKTVPKPGMDAGDKAIGNVADQLAGTGADNQASNAFGNMANQLAGEPAAQPTQSVEPAKQEPTAGSNAFGQMATQLSKQPAQKVPPVKVGTSFLFTTPSGKQVKATKTDTGWKVAGSMVTDPKTVSKLELQANNLGPQPKQTKVTAGGPTPAERQALEKRIQAAGGQEPQQPVRQLKAPSALAKGTPGKPATAGKSRIR